MKGRPVLPSGAPSVFPDLAESGACVLHRALIQRHQDGLRLAGLDRVAGGGDRLKAGGGSLLVQALEDIVHLAALVADVIIL